MPNLTAITLNNGLAQAIAFTPSGIDSKGIASFQQDDNTRPFEARQRLTVAAKQPTRGGSQAFRTTIKVSVPTTDNNVLPEKFVSDNFVNIEFVIGKNAALHTRQDLLAYAIDVLQEQMVTDMVVDQEGIW